MRLALLASLLGFPSSFQENRQGRGRKSLKSQGRQKVSLLLCSRTCSSNARQTQTDGRSSGPCPRGGMLRRAGWCSGLTEP